MQMYLDDNRTIGTVWIQEKYIFVIARFIVLFLTGCGKIKTNKEAEEYIGDNYEEVIYELNKADFTNIETVEIDDLTSSGNLPDGSVSEVSIDGNIEFASRATFSKDVKVLVTYHIIKKLSSPITIEQISVMSYSEVADFFQMQDSRMCRRKKYMT